MPTLVYAGMALPDARASLERDYAVAVDGNRIADAGPLDTLRVRYPRADEVGGADLVLLPAMVDSHDHGRGLGTTPLGVPDDILEVWLLGLRAQPAIDPYLAAAYDGLRLLRSGVCAVAHSHNPRDRDRLREEAEATLRGYRDAGIRVAFYLPIQDQHAVVYDEEAFLASVPAAARADCERLVRAGYLDRRDYLGLCDALARAHDDSEGSAVRIQVSPVGGQWCSDGLIMACVDFAKAHNTRAQMHLLETRYQRAYARRAWGASFVRHFDEIGALGPWLTLAHMVWVDPEDVPLLADRRVGVAHNPSSNLRLRSGVAPVPELLAAGVTVGVGLDGHALDEDQDYLRELRLAWTLANRSGAASRVVTARDAWAMGTRAGAAITLGEHVPLGALRPGSFADLVLVDHGTGLDDWTIGLSAQGNDADMDALVPDLLLRSVSHRNVRHVMVGGRWVVRDGRSARLDEAGLVAELRADLARQAAKAPGTGAGAARRLAPLIRRFYAGWEASSLPEDRPRARAPLREGRGRGHD